MVKISMYTAKEKRLRAADQQGIRYPGGYSFKIISDPNRCDGRAIEMETGMLVDEIIDLAETFGIMKAARMLKTGKVVVHRAIAYDYLRKSRLLDRLRD